MWFTGYCGGSGWVGLLLMVGMWAGLLAIVFWGVRRMFPAGRRREEPPDLLAEHPAAEEIEPDELGHRRAHAQRAGIANANVAPQPSPLLCTRTQPP